MGNFLTIIFLIMKKKLKSYKHLDFLNINILYGTNNITFNLQKELLISENENNLNKELKFQPASYGFLILLHKKLLTRFEQIKQRRKKVYSSAYLKAKETLVSGRYASDDMSRAKADTDKKFIKLTKLAIKAKDDADTIFACMKAFEQRKDLLQTLSSNNRKF